MSITVIRKTGVFGMGAGMSIKVNGQKISRITEDQQLEITIPNETARIKVSQQGMKSNELTVQEGDTIEIRTSIWSYINPFLLILIPIFLRSTSSIPTSTSIIFTFAALIIINLFLMNGFRIFKHLQE